MARVPNCGQLSSFIGDAWRIDSETLLPPPPLRAFADGVNFASWTETEGDAWNRGEVDARSCVHCEELTFAHHTPLVAQTNLKTSPPPFLEDIQREMRVVVQDADHVVLLGYSLPPDDVVYRAFLSARSRRSREPVRCSVVTLDPGYESFWTYPDTVAGVTDLPSAVLSAQSLFGPQNVRFHPGGFPAVLLDSNAGVNSITVDRLLQWDPV